MQANVQVIEIKKDKNGKPYFRMHLSNNINVNLFARDFGMLQMFTDVYKELSIGSIGDKYTISPPIGIVTAENDRGWYHIVSIEPQEKVTATRIAPKWLDKKYQHYSNLSAQRQLKCLANTYAVGIDFETTDKYPDTAEIVSVGIVSPEFEFYSLVRPSQTALDNNETSDAYKIHHIKTADLQDAPTFDDIYSTLFGYLAGHVWYAYNADFDIQLLDSLCQRHDIPRFPRMGEHCIMKLYAEFVAEPNQYQNGWAWHKLADACYQRGVDLDNAHNALDDIRATYRLLQTFSD